MRTRGERPRPWIRAVRSGCPIDLVRQIWVETSMRWFLGEFGREAALGEVAVPTAEFLPVPYSVTQEQIKAMVMRAYDRMSVQVPGVRVRVFGDVPDRDAAARATSTRRTVGHFHTEGGRPVISLEAGEITDPAVLTAVIAHELGHVRLLGERRITTSRKDHERLTDLLTVYLGYGVFTANAALRYGKTALGFTARPTGYLDERRLNAARDDGYSRLGYLSEVEFGYALACHAWLRRESDPAWAGHLDPGPRIHLEQGLAYLLRAATNDTFPTHALAGGRISIRVVAAVDDPLTGLYVPTPRLVGGERPDLGPVRPSEAGIGR